MTGPVPRGTARDLPDALVIGPMKAGTTWIHDHLAARGDICLPRSTKETFFFDRDVRRGVAWYRRQFAPTAAHRRTVEVAPSLFHHPDAPDRVREVLGDVPLIVTLRDPVERAWSHYLHLRRYGHTDLPLRDAARAFPALLDASRHDAQIARWQGVLTSAVITTLRMEDLRRDPQTYARQLAAALHLPPVPARVSDGAVSYAGAVAPSYQLARAARLGAAALRRLGLGRLVGAAKSLGGRHLVFGNPARSMPPKLSEADRLWLADRLGAGMKDAVDLGPVAVDDDAFIEDPRGQLPPR